MDDSLMKGLRGSGSEDHRPADKTRPKAAVTASGATALEFTLPFLDVAVSCL